MELEDLRLLRLLRLPQVLALVGVSRSTLNAMVARGEFPPPILVGRRAIAWPAYVVARWLENRPSARPSVSG